MVLTNVKSILDPKDYAGAQNWLRSLSEVPEAIRYPSVRDPQNGGINFAIFEPSAVLAASAQIEDLVLTPNSDGSVLVENLTRGGSYPIKPIR
jgi:RES domain